MMVIIPLWLDRFRWFGIDWKKPNSCPEFISGILQHLCATLDIIRVLIWHSSINGKGWWNLEAADTWMDFSSCYRVYGTPWITKCVRVLYLPESIEALLQWTEDFRAWGGLIVESVWCLMIFVSLQTVSSETRGGVKLEGYMEMIFLFTPTWCTVYYCLGISTPRLGKTTIWDKIKLLYTWLSGVPGTYGTKTLAYLWFQMGALGSVGRKQIIAPSSRQGWKLSGNQPTSEVSRSQF